MNAAAATLANTKHHREEEKKNDDEEGKINARIKFMMFGTLDIPFMD